MGPPLIEDAGYFVRAGVGPAELGGLLFQPVRVKRDGSYMPAFTPEELSDEQVMTLGAWLAGHFEAPADPPQLGDATHGAELYALNCALCHGEQGEGNGQTIPLAAIVSELRAHEMSPATILGFTHLYARTGGASEMTVFSEEFLSDADLDDIAAFIWELPPLGPPPGAEADQG